jgi:DNA-binding IclR family transcriptional regulator
MRDRLDVVYLESSRGEFRTIHPPDIGLSYPVIRLATGRVLLAAYSRE